MKSNIINIFKGVSGYLLFVFLITIFINTSSEDDTGNRSQHLITLTEFIVNCISFASLLGVATLLIVFFEDRKYSLKLISLYFLLLFISCAYYSFGSKIGTAHISSDLITNSFILFFLFSFISFFVLFKAFSNR